MLAAAAWPGAQVPALSYYKDLRVVVESCIHEVALQDPAVMQFVRLAPPGELFERIPLDLLERVVRAVSRIRAQVAAAQGVEPLEASEAAAADAALAGASRTELADMLMDFGENDAYGRMLCSRGKVRQRQASQRSPYVRLTDCRRRDESSPFVPPLARAIQGAHWWGTAGRKGAQ